MVNGSDPRNKCPVANGVKLWHQVQNDDNFFQNMLKKKTFEFENKQKLPYIFILQYKARYINQIIDSREIMFRI